ncbi:MAG: zinc ABC transporter substrate-binding protein [Halofilum sp. (in: g-proteobacteria)]|nr:zinc ABC transporter substrate-binding protein [Halofilum sp. (in: g-proteobacteria)]
MSLPRPLLLALLLVPAAATAAAPRLVASIAPIHSLVAGVTDGVVTPRLLVPGGRSPHAFALAPSDTRALAGADAVFLAGGASERFLERPLASLAADARLVRMSAAPGVRRLAARSGGAWADAHDHDSDHGDQADQPGHSEHAGGGDTTSDAGLDPHLWLDPGNAIAFTRAVADALAAMDPAHAGRYRDNATRQVERLRALDATLARRLAPVAGRPYLVFHDAYQYLEARYGLAAAGSITVDPGRPPGARRLAGLRERIRERDIRCLFIEPQFEPAIARTIAQGTPARIAELDPLGAGLEPGPGLYPALMRRLADGLVGCLGA